MPLDSRSSPPDTCLFERLVPDDAGQVSCSVTVLQTDTTFSSEEQCTEAGFLPSNEQGRFTCRIPQLEWEDRARGGARGWHYDEPANCPPFEKGAVRFLPDTVSGDTAGFVTCGLAFMINPRTHAVEATHVSECTQPIPSASISDVGKACMPVVPADGFSKGNIYVTSGTPECASGACIVNQVRGDPSADCEPRAPDPETDDPGHVCASVDEVERGVYCSCRCDAPDSDSGARCGCPEEYDCLPVLPEGAPGIRGSYCVRSGTFTEP